MLLLYLLNLFYSLNFMLYGININPVLPLRKEPAEQSEMITQLLFGEHFTVLEEREKWLKIRNCADFYEGWADRKMIILLNKDGFERLENEKNAFFVKNIFLFCENKKGDTIVLPAGSKLLFFNEKENTFGFSDQFKILSENVTNEQTTVSETAMLFLNAPYLWGGKTIFGIDCSGLTQVVFSLLGISLPRDAYQQAKCGENVASLKEAKTNDLVFFTDREGKISHVGILLDNERIIHASGKVRIDKIDEKGIIFEKKYTHKLHSIRRINVECRI